MSQPKLTEKNILRTVLKGSGRGPILPAPGQTPKPPVKPTNLKK